MRTNEKLIVNIITFLTVIVISIVWIATHTNFKSVAEKADLVAHTHQVINSSESILSWLREAESSQRGYLVSGDSSYIFPYFQALDSTNKYVQHLVRLTADNPEQRGKVNSIQESIASRIVLLQQGIALKSSGNMEALQQFISSQRSRDQMESTSALVTSVVLLGNERLKSRQEALSVSISLANGIIYAVIGLYFLTILLGNIALRRLISKRKYFEEELQNLNHELTAVNEELHASNEELHASNEELAASTEELTAYNEQLAQLKDELEKRVEERTATIQSTNQKLIAEIAERKRTEEAFRQGEERFRVAIANSPITVYNQDAQLRYSWLYNPRMVGVNESIIGKTDAELYSEAEAKQLWELKRGVLENGHIVNQEISLSANKERHYYVLTVEPLFNREKRIAGITCAAFDITEQKRTEERLRRTLDELKKRNHELDNYVYKVSHDLRAPLVSILGLVSLMKEEQDMTTIQQYTSMIESRIQKSDEFIKSILSHSKTLNADIQPVEINFPKVAHDCLEELRYLPGYDDVSMQLDIRDGEAFYSDELRISILFKNFISNAIKYRNPQRRDSFCRISVETDAQKANIVITDNGIGIDEQYKNRIFDMFFRATEKSQGSGLGLYIVKQALEKLHGDINVESQLGQGTMFQITLANLRPVSTLSSGH